MTSSVTFSKRQRTRYVSALFTAIITASEFGPVVDGSEVGASLWDMLAATQLQDYDVIIGVNQMDAILIIDSRSEPSSPYLPPGCGIWPQVTQRAAKRNTEKSLLCSFSSIFRARVGNLQQCVRVLSSRLPQLVQSTATVQL